MLPKLGTLIVTPLTVKFSDFFVKFVKTERNNYGVTTLYIIARNNSYGPMFLER